MALGGRRADGVSAQGSHANSQARQGAVAQLGEHLLCKQGVTGSIPVSSTTRRRKTTKGKADFPFVVFAPRSGSLTIWNDPSIEALTSFDETSHCIFELMSRTSGPDPLGLYGQATKRIRWMPRR